MTVRVDAEDAIRAIFEATSVCIIGASENESTPGGQALDRLLRHGFTGRVDLVNPRRSEIGSYECRASVLDWPEAADVALVCVNATQCLAAVRDCGAAGIRSAVILASGFNETESGQALARELGEAAINSGVRLVGPNTEGVWSIANRVLLTFGSVSRREFFRAGSASIISQSGGIGTAFIRHLQDRGVGCDYFVGVGNELDLDCLDFLSYIVRRARPAVVALYTEGLRNGSRLRAIMNEARSVGVQVVAFHAGTSDAGRAATASHSGRMSSLPQLYRDVFREVGVIQAESVQDLWMVAETLCVCGQVAGCEVNGGLGVISISGGCRGVIADRVAQEGLTMPKFHAETRRALEEVLPPYATCENPMDPTGAPLYEPGLLREIVRLVMADDGIGVVLIQLGNSALRQMDELVQVLVDLRGEYAKPVVVSSIGDHLPASEQTRLSALHAVWAASPDEAVKRASWILQAS